MRKTWRDTEYRDMLWNIATATTISHYDIQMEELKKFDSSAHEWLTNIPVETWSISHFTGRAKTDGLTNNLCEVFNSKLINARDKPIITCLEYVREYLMKRMVIVQKEIDKVKGKTALTPTARGLLDRIRKDAAQNKCIFNGAFKTQVTTPSKDQYVVNFKDKTCSCRYWEITGIVCSHAVSALWDKVNHGETAVPNIEAWVHPIYWLETWEAMYANKVDPINGRKMWPKSPVPTTITAPNHHTQVGRPKKKRKRAAGEVVNTGKNLSRKYLTVTCTKCGNKGHNMRTCKGQGGETEVSNAASKRQKQAASKAKSVTGKRAGSKAGSVAGSQAGSVAGKVAGSQAGSVAGSQAGIVIGKQAVSQGGSKVGSKAKTKGKGKQVVKDVLQANTKGKGKQVAKKAGKK